MSEVIDNRAHRVRTLKEIIQRLHAGAPEEAVRNQLVQIVKQTDYTEIVAMEQELMAGGMKAEEIQSMCDLHSRVTRDVLVQLPARAVEPGHPADTFRRENDSLQGVINTMRAVAADPEGKMFAWHKAFNDLMDVEKHYQRKEHCFFPMLEKHNIMGPPKVMWGKDDEIRGLLKATGEALHRPEAAAEWRALAAGAGEAALRGVEEMIYKENNILLPLCLEVFTDEDWAEIWASSPRYGWCLVEPQEGYRPSEKMLKEGLKLPVSEAIELPTGNLSLQQLTAIFSTLPVDLTFVDANDRVAFFSEGPNRVFARSRAVIGRKVQHCHPPRSVAVVDQILDDFRSGRQSVAEFWIHFTGRFVHIRYFAVRDEQGAYLGTLEVTQDVGSIRALEGERRLLEYGSSAAPAEQPAADADPVTETIDGGALLAQGIHPLERVRQAAAALAPGKAVRLLTPFRPEPLLAAMTAAGFQVETRESGPGRHETLITRRPA